MNLAQQILAVPRLTHRQAAIRFGCSVSYIRQVRRGETKGASGALTVRNDQENGGLVEKWQSRAIASGACQHISAASYPDTCGAPASGTYCRDCLNALAMIRAPRFHSVKTIRHTA